MGEPALKNTMSIYTPKNEQDWHHTRDKGIGASEAAIILGKSSFMSPLMLFYVKRCEIPRPDDTDLTLAGKLFEPQILKWFQQETGFKTTHNAKQSIYMRDIYFCTPDAFVNDGRIDTFAEIKFSIYDDGFKDDVPVKYLIQCQHQMYVADLPYMYLAYFALGKFNYRVISRNDDFIQILIQREREFWNRINQNEPPEAGANDAVIFNLLYKNPIEEFVDLPEDMIVQDQRLQEIKPLIKELENEKKTIENRMKQLIGTTAGGVLPNGITYGITQVNKPETVVKATSYIQLRRRV